MFPIFDKFNEDNFLVDNQEINLNTRNLSTINRQYNELGTLRTWVHGEQEADQDLNIISRRYAELTFDNSACDFDFNDAGFEEEIYGGRYYWRVIHKFTEHEYYSENTSEFENFLIWEESNHRFQMDIIYRHELIDTLEWVRPFEEQISTSGPNTLGNTCPISNNTESNDEQTGNSDWELLLNNNPVLCKRYLSVSIPYYKVFDVGQALGAVIKGDLPDNIYLFDIKPEIINSANIDIGQLLQPLLEQVDYRNSNITLENSLQNIVTDRGLTNISSTGTFTNPIRLRQRYIILEYRNPTSTIPQNGTIDLYGEEYYRSFLPLTRDMDPLLPEHPPGTEFINRTDDNTIITRYKPPGRPDFPDNFWNDINIDTIDSFGSRVGNNAEGVI